MNGKQPPSSVTASCRCGQVAFEALGAPILSAACYCLSCQEAGRQFEKLPGADRVLDADGGTGYVLYRTDRVRHVRGEEFLQEHQLKAASPTRRVLATCCNTPVFLDVTQAHWLTLYRDRLPEGTQPLQMRVMTKHRRAGAELAGNIPNYSGQSGKFMWKLLLAWISMGFRIPKFPYGRTAA